MKVSPIKKASKVPIAKKGAKGTSDFKVFFFKIIKKIPVKAPKKNEKNKPAKIFGQLKKRPKKKASLTSPKPIHLPLEIKKIKRKKEAASTAAKRAEIKTWKSKLLLKNSKNLYKKTVAIAGKITLSGIR